MGEGQAAEVSGVDSQEQQIPQAKKVASFSPLGEGEKGRQERALAEGLNGAPSLPRHSTPIPDSGGFLSPTWTMVELKLH